MFIRRIPSGPYRIVLLAAGALLILYILITRDSLGLALLALFAVFLGLPALVLFLGNRRGPQPPSKRDEAPSRNGATPPAAS